MEDPAERCGLFASVSVRYSTAVIAAAEVIIATRTAGSRYGYSVKIRKEGGKRRGTGFARMPPNRGLKL